MFLLMGFFAMQAGIGNDLFDACKWLGRLPGASGGRHHGRGGAFGVGLQRRSGCCSLLALPEMASRGYNKGFASARSPSHARGAGPAERPDGRLRHSDH
jgi:hypothetical protein